MAVVTHKEDGMDNMVFWPNRKIMERYEDAIFSFDESYATRRRKHLSFPYAHVPKSIKLININILKKWEKSTEHQCTIHCPPWPWGGKFFII